MAASASAPRQTVAANAALDLIAEIDKVEPRAIGYSPIQFTDRVLVQASPLALKLATRLLEIREELGVLSVRTTYAEAADRTDLIAQAKQVGSEGAVIENLFRYQLQTEADEWGVPLTLRDDGVIVVTAEAAAKDAETATRLAALSDQLIETVAGGSPACNCFFCRLAGSVKRAEDAGGEFSEDDIPKDVKEMFEQIFGGDVRFVSPGFGRGPRRE